jgi:hypothetical protein
MIATLFSLSTHNSPETAYVIKDWPYGRTLRCEKHVWIETKKNFGQRAVYRTTNPKRGNSFNANKNGNYYNLVVFGANADGLLEFDDLNQYSHPAEYQRIEKLLLEQGDSEQIAHFERVLASARKGLPNTWAEWDAKENQRILAQIG